MCGLAGILTSKLRIDAALLRSMTDPMIARGPDSSGEWFDAEAGIGLGHRRLAILDLSEAGHQPMVSASGRLVLSYNGEIYNFADLRSELEQAGQAPSWRGHSDSEVLLAAIEAWGLQTALEKAEGMFALALWDREARRLALARDRFGEKPLYYGWTAAGFAFASTLAPIRALPGFDNAVDPAALAALMARGCIAAPLSIHRRIFKLPPGSLLLIDAAAAATPRDAPLPAQQWFDYAAQVLEGAANPVSDRDEALDGLEAVLGGAVRRQMVADVPVGTFLSGGIDSSLITALAQRSSAGPVRSFTIGFHEARFDEAQHARKVAAAIGTDHHELYVTAQDARDVIPMLPQIYDEPFADSSQIPTFMVSRLAREQVTVSLSGDGGDELFGGYARHGQLARQWQAIGWLNPAARRMLLGPAAAAPARLWSALGRLTGRGSERFGINARRALANLAGSGGLAQLYDRTVDEWPGAAPVAGTPHRAAAADPRLGALDPFVQLLHRDAASYLPDDILAKVDRAGMAVSLESRIPLLDLRVTAYAARISPLLKRDGQGGKAVLKQLLYRHVPRALVDRPKAGFGVPVSDWLRGPLRDWAEALLSPASLEAEGLLDARLIRQRWQRHLSGAEDAGQALWHVLMYQAWRG